MKKCTICKTDKELSEFNNKQRSKDKLSPECRVCANLRSLKYRHSMKGKASHIYYTQVQSSKDRGHNPPSYSIDELIDYLLSSSLFNKLHERWIKSGYLKDLAPSVDRLCDKKGYSFDNIQIVTWEENNKKSWADKRSAKLIVTTNPQRAVIQLTKNGDYFAEFVSIAQAGRETGISALGISKCCRGHKKNPHAGGFKWAFKASS